MRSIINYLFIFFIISSSSLAQNKELSVKETKEILKKYQWKLRRYEKNDKMFTISDEHVGSRLIFTASDEMFFHNPNHKKEVIDSRSFTLTKDKIFFGELVEDPRITYKLEDFLGYVLRLTYDDLDKDFVYVFEQEEEIAKNYFPAGKSAFIGANRNSFDSTPFDAIAVIESIDEICKEAIGNIRIIKEGGDKVIIKDASFKASEMGVKYSYKVQYPDELIYDISIEFMPEDIKTISQKNTTKGSPIGRVLIDFYGATSNYYQLEKNKTWYDYYSDNSLLNFLVIDPANYKKLEDKLNKLKAIYYTDRKERLKLLESFMEVEKKYWVSTEEGVSNTYTLNDVYSTGTTLRFYYDLQTISTKGDSKGTYITEIPLKQIENLTFDKSKSKPNTIILHSGKTEFKTYLFNENNDEYVISNTIKSLPVFIDVSNNNKKERVVELLTTHIKECSGKTLKLKTL